MERDPLLIRPLGTFETGMDILERRGAGHMVRVIECDGVVDADRARLAVQAVVADVACDRGWRVRVHHGLAHHRRALRWTTP